MKAVAAAEFKGFHRIEKQLWQAGNTQGLAPVADDALNEDMVHETSGLFAVLPGIREGDDFGDARFA